MTKSSNIAPFSMNHITLAVREIERSFVFYRDIVRLKPLVKWDKGAYFLVGHEEEKSLWFCLNVDKKRKASECYTHYAFSVKLEDFELITAKIINSGAPIFKENTSPGNSLYFLDPDGHKLEMHVGDWHSRLTFKKTNPGNWQNIEWFI